MVTVSILTLLCQSADGAELEQTARELGATGIRWLYGSMHCDLPDGQRGSFRPTHAFEVGVAGAAFHWCAHDAAE